MKLTVLVVSAVMMTAIPAAAGAAITVIGNSSARLCFEAAENELGSKRVDLETCDRALTEENLSKDDMVATHVNRGILRARRGDVSGSLADFDAASAIDPNEPEAYLNKGLVLTIKADQAAPALPFFTMALEKNTRRPALAYFGRAAAYEQLGKLKSAYSDYSRAQEADPKWDAPRAELARFTVRK